MFCKSGEIPLRCRNQRGVPCDCIHRIKVPLNSIVELIIVDEVNSVNASVSHPFHLHGYKLYVTEINQNPFKHLMTVETAKNIIQNQKLRPKARKYPMKDTISIPRNGFTRFRFKADNPGFWLMHCHYEWHLSNGMALVFQVGETYEMVPPPIDFPKCNNYTPNKLSGVFKPQWIPLTGDKVLPENCHVGGQEDASFKGIMYIGRRSFEDEVAIGKYNDEWKRVFGKISLNSLNS